MTTFTNDAEAKRLIEKITPSSCVFFNNEGIEITLNNNNAADFIHKLKETFSNVSLKGRKVKSIFIKRLNMKTNGLRVTEVTY
jgi:hypothetical protein